MRQGRDEIPITHKKKREREKSMTKERWSWARSSLEVEGCGVEWAKKSETNNHGNEKSSFL